MKKKAVVAAGVTALLAGSAQGRGRDPGPPDHREVRVADFDRIAVAGPFVVRVHEGTATKVSLSGPRTMLDDTELLVRDRQLVIHWQEGAGWSRNGNEGVDVDISVPVLRGVTNVGAGSIDIDQVKADRFVAVLSSAGSVSIGSIDTSELKAAVAGAGSLSLGHVQAKALDADLAGAGQLRAAGKADTANVRLAGSGSFDNPEFTARNATIMSGGSGTIRANVTNEADIKALGSGIVVVTGGAKCTVNSTGSGGVRCS